MENFDETTMDDESYQWNASDYAGHSSAQFEWAGELIEKLHLDGNESVLDIGCGDGKVSAAVAGRIPAGVVVGIDSSREMIELARKNYSGKLFPNLSFLVMDARHIRLSRKFHVAFSTAALHWVADQRTVLDGVKSCMAAGGRILFQMGGKGNGEEIFALVPLMADRRPWRRYLADVPFPWAFQEPEAYTRLLVEAGFAPKRAELIPKDMAQKGREGLAGWIRTTWLPFLERIPNHLKEAFISEVADEYIQTHPPDAEGLVHVRMMRLEVEATGL